MSKWFWWTSVRCGALLCHDAHCSPVWLLFQVHWTASRSEQRPMTSFRRRKKSTPAQVSINLEFQTSLPVFSFNARKNILTNYFLRHESIYLFFRFCSLNSSTFILETVEENLRLGPKLTIYKKSINIGQYCSLMSWSYWPSFKELWQNIQIFYSLLLLSPVPNNFRQQSLSNTSSNFFCGR